MKNIHIIPTDKPSRLHNKNGELGNYPSTKLYIEDFKGNQYNSFHIYITSDEEIKKGDWFFNGEHILRCSRITDIIIDVDGLWSNIKTSKKIILTTDQDLIKDGVQAIDDEFLEWFVKNPSFEEVEIKKDEFYCKNDFINGKDAITYNYKTIIPKEELTISDEAKQRAKNYMSLKGALEPKQETLEEAAEKIINETFQKTFLEHPKGGRLTNETIIEVLQIFFKLGAKWQQERMYSEEEVENILIEYVKTNPTKPYKVVSWFKQFKKK